MSRARRRPQWAFTNAHSDHFRVCLQGKIISEKWMCCRYGNKFDTQYLASDQRYLTVHASYTQDVLQSVNEI